MLNARSKRVLLGGYVDDQFSEDAVKFRLTYEGPLPASQNDARNEQRDPKADVKQRIRKYLHPQLKKLWETHPSLVQWKLEEKESDRKWRVGGLHQFEQAYVGDTENLLPGPKPQMIPVKQILADQYARLGYRFVPLVWEALDLICSIDVLFLRRGKSGNLFSEGDVDNRIKTLVDALRCPSRQNELGSFTSPGIGEDPFYVLLEDDKYLSHFSVETDELLDPVGGNHDDASIVRLIITVELKPWSVGLMNFHLS